MGTRSLTVFVDVFDDGTEEEIVVMYRHLDGYPTGHGQELADYLSDKTIVNGLVCGEDNSKAFNRPGCMAMTTASYFKSANPGPGGFCLYPAGTRDCWEDYTYTIRGKVGDPITMKVEMSSRVIFDGPAQAFDGEEVLAAERALYNDPNDSEEELDSLRPLESNSP